MAYAPHTTEDIRVMLATIGVESVAELFASIPPGVRLDRELDLPPGISEAALRREIGRIAAKNRSAADMVSYAGAGVYEHDTPAVVKHLALRSEFATAYTPYQAEVSQGTLQVIYEFQSYICRLSGLDVSNASLYDGATALAEAILMAHAATRRRRVLLPATLYNSYRQVMRTYAQGWDLSIEEIPVRADGRMDLEALETMLDEQVACVVVSQPNALGVLEDAQALGRRLATEKALLIAVVNPISLLLLQPPGEWGADIAVGEGQSLGIPMSFGGPQCGFIAVKDGLKRRLPGRLVGETVDVDGQRGFVLTLQTREQHIRREKATSNICTNQGLFATMATIYMSTLGRVGLTQVAEGCHAKAHYLADRLTGIDGLSLPFEAPFFQEFVLRWTRPAREVLKAFTEHGIVAGVPLEEVQEGADERDLLVAVSELRTREELDDYAQRARAIATGGAR